MSEANDRTRADHDPPFVLFSSAQWTAIRAHFALTPRQMQICKFIGQGQADKNIAAALGITLDTVRMHLREIFRKLDVKSRVKLVVKLVITNRELQAAPAESPERRSGARKGNITVQCKSRRATDARSFADQKPLG